MTIEQWDRTVAVYMAEPLMHSPADRRIWKDASDPDRMDRPWHIGVVTRNTTHFRLGDVVIVSIENGSGERQPVYGRSSRGRDILGLFMQYARYKDNSLVAASKRKDPRFDNKTPVRIVEFPGGLADRLPTDPAIRRFVETLCAGSAGPPVSADTGPNFEPQLVVVDIDDPTVPTGFIPAFKSEDWFEIKGRAGMVATTKLDRDTEDFAHLLGHIVTITTRGRARLFRCKGVERFCHNPPWRQGEPIGLLVESAE